MEMMVESLTAINKEDHNNQQYLQRK